MNDLVAEVLTAAAMRGHPQITGKWHSDEGECALGALHVHLHDGDIQMARACRDIRCTSNDDSRMAHIFGLSQKDRSALSRANDLGWDFLTIARKVGTESS